MPIFQLSKDDQGFPPAYFADSQGMLAVGGDLSAARVVQAYQQGIYFWFGPMDMIKWWSPDPRIILVPDQIERMPNLVTDGPFEIQVSSQVEPLIRQLQVSENQGEMGPNWVTEEMFNLYSDLAEAGYCKVVHILQHRELLGKLLVLIFGKAIFIEYLYNNDGDNSVNTNDIMVTAFAQHLARAGITFIDIQKETVRISDIGIQEIPRLEYLDRLNKAINGTIENNFWTTKYEING